MSKRIKWFIIAGVAVVLAVVVGGPYVYIHFIKDPAPERLSLETLESGGSGGSGGSTTLDTTPLAATIDGVWKPTSASQVGYRVNEVLFGQKTTAVGRTNKVTGQLTIAGTTMSAATFTTDMTSVKSDESQRDSQFNGRIMSVSQFPTSTFTLTKPIDFGRVTANKEQLRLEATGNLTLRGVTKPVTFSITAQRDGQLIDVSGTIPITFADWNIPNPSFGPATTEDHGELELLLVFAKS